MRILIIAVGIKRINMQWINGRVRETIRLGALLGGDYVGIEGSWESGVGHANNLELRYTRIDYH